MVLERVKILDELLANQWKSIKELQELQLRKLKALLIYADEKVPFHHRRFKQSGFDPRELVSISGITRIPAMSKEDLRNTPLRELTSSDLREGEGRRILTSGTTGPPTTVLLNKNSLDSRAAVRERASDSIGLEPWQRRAHLFFTNSVAGGARHPFRERVAGALLSAKRRYSRPFYFTRSCEEILGGLLKYRPQAIEAQPAYLTNLARTLTKTQSVISVKMLISNGDVMVPPRENRLESFFGCPVYDFYGSRDAGVMAWQCREKNGYHMNIDASVYEVTARGEPCQTEEVGNLLLTNLNEYAMPLIRFEVGDLVTLSDEKCRCGRSLPTLRTIEGRASETLASDSGGLLTPRGIEGALQEIPDMPPYQFREDTRGALTLNLYGKSVPTETVEAVRRTCRNLLGDRTPREILLVREEPLAKIRHVVRAAPSIGSENAQPSVGPS